MFALKVFLNFFYSGLFGYSSIELIKILVNLKINKTGERKDYIYISGVTSFLLFGTIKCASNILCECRKLSIV
jgi:hypothetical protein